MATPKVFILTGLIEYVGELSTTKVLSVYSNSRAATIAATDTETEGWNKTRNRPASENDKECDEIIQYDTVEVLERTLNGAEKIIQRKKRN